MLYFVDGSVAVIEPNLAVIDCGGVGYACATTNHTLSQLKKGEKTRLYTHLNVREDAVDLFGFASQRELSCFRQLLGVSGVGPKAALAILSATTPDSLALAILSGDEKALTAAPGIGKKIAQRIILELKDKMAQVTTEVGFTAPAVSGQMAVGSKAAEAAAALAVLGYSSQDAAAALKGLDVENLPLEELIRQALKRMVRN
ncbi:MAG: Holliday junction branch migration protein RuvA [Oscillospiraceae bacterium]|nr:Holliday junction branch migration protein RuvA [Oscillospiraceae bacterium]MBR6678329.1 Holliday junction branch migration protein RuvA [Oscillospiraceae bacterium]